MVLTYTLSVYLWLWYAMTKNTWSFQTIWECLCFYLCFPTLGLKNLGIHMYLDGPSFSSNPTHLVYHFCMWCKICPCQWFWLIYVIYNILSCVFDWNRCRVISEFNMNNILSLVHFEKNRVGLTENCIFLAKNLGRFWLAYSELQGDFYMHQLWACSDTSSYWKGSRAHVG